MDKHVKFTIIDRSCAICGKYVALGSATFVGYKRMHTTCKKRIAQYLPALDLTNRCRAMVRKVNETAEAIRKKWS